MLISPSAALADVEEAVGGGFALSADVLGLVTVPPTPDETWTATEPDDGFDEVADVVGPVDVLGAATAGVLHVESQASGVFGENHDATVRSEASAADVVVAPLTNGITVEAVSSTCVANGDGASGITEIVDLRVGGTPITIPSTAPNTTIDVLGLATIVINEQFESNVPGVGSGITVNALHITLLGGAGEVILAQSRCLVAGPNVLIPQIPTITVDKTALTPTLPVPGGDFSFRVQVTNTSPEAVALTSLVDDVHGDLDGEGTCETPTTINPGATYTCQFTGEFTGIAGATETDTVTATAVDIGGDINPPVTASDTATVSIVAPTGDVPEITVTKTAVPETLPAPGGTFTYNIRVTNTGDEAVSVTGLTDNIYGNLDTRAGSTCDVPVVLAVDAFFDCSFTGPFTGAAGAMLTDTVTATAVDTDGDNNTVSDTDTATVTIVAGDVPAIEVDKSASPGSLPVPGGDFTFTVTVTNTGAEQVSLTTLTDDVYGNLDGQGTCDVPATINIGGNYSCNFVGNFTGAAGATETDTVTATATDTDGDNNTVTDTDSATVSIQIPGSNVRVEKSATPSSRPEPGGDFTFTVRVVNTGGAPVTIQTITDSIYGNLATRAGSNCGTLINTSVAVGATATCAFTVNFTGDAGDSETNTVTVTGTGITATAGSETISITNAAPMIRVAKDAIPTSRPEPGGTFTFRVTVSNLTGEQVVISTITDDVHGDLNGEGTCDSGAVLAASTSYVCEFDAEFTGVAGDSETDIVTVTVVDDEGTSSSAQGDATVTITPKGTAVPTIIVNNITGVTCTSTATTTASSGEYRIAQVNINNNSSCVSSAVATAGAKASPTPTAKATPPKTLARTGQDAAKLLALAAALMALGYLLMAGNPKRRRGDGQA